MRKAMQYMSLRSNQCLQRMKKTGDPEVAGYLKSLVTLAAWQLIQRRQVVGLGQARVDVAGAVDVAVLVVLKGTCASHRAA
jgi:hypothetical protein